MSEELKPTLTQSEQEWLGKWFQALETNQAQMLKTLKSINTAVQIMAALVLITVVVSACSAILNIRVP